MTGWAAEKSGEVAVTTADPTSAPVTVAVPVVEPWGITTVVEDSEMLALLLPSLTLSPPNGAALGRVMAVRVVDFCS